MVHQVGRIFGNCTGGKIRCQGDYSHPQWWAYRDCDYVFVDGVIQAYTCIKTIRHDVSESIIDVEFNVDVRVFVYVPFYWASNKLAAKLLDSMSCAK